MKRIDPRFAAIVDELYGPYERLMAQSPRNADEIPRGTPVRGVYLFSECGNHLYVGRTNNICGRYGRHCNPGATHRMAAFAFRLAREATGKIKATYRAGDGSRKHLMEDAKFVVAFTDAKRRIRNMDFRWVKETDPVRQCLLEVYCAVALETPYNDFDNH